MPRREKDKNHFTDTETVVCAGFKFKPLHFILIKCNRRNKSVTQVSTQFQKNVFFNTKFTVSLKLKIHLILIICTHVCNTHLHVCVMCVYRQKDRDRETKQEPEKRDRDEVLSLFKCSFLWLCWVLAAASRILDLHCGM